MRHFPVIIYWKYFILCPCLFLKHDCLCFLQRRIKNLFVVLVKMHLNQHTQQEHYSQKHECGYDNVKLLTVFWPNQPWLLSFDLQIKLQFRVDSLLKTYGGNVTVGGNQTVIIISNCKFRGNFLQGTRISVLLSRLCLLCFTDKMSMFEIVLTLLFLNGFRVRP